MNAPRPSAFRDSQPVGFGGRAGFSQALGGPSSMKWAALQEAGEAVAVLAGVPRDKPSAEIRNFPALLRGAPDQVRLRAEHGIDDLAAVMEPGLAALLAVKARGAEATAPARTLWREFTAARAALLALAPRVGTMGPPRSA